MEDPTDEQLRPATGWGGENHVPNSRPTIIIVIDVRRAVEENWQTRKGVKADKKRCQVPLLELVASTAAFPTDLSSGQLPPSSGSDWNQPLDPEGARRSLPKPPERYLTPLFHFGLVVNKVVLIVKACSTIAPMQTKSP